MKHAIDSIQFQAQNTNSPTAEGALPATVAKEDIPAVDADVKDSENPMGAAGAGQTNGESKEKAPEPRKDPREDPIGWINSLIPGAVHKV